MAKKEDNKVYDYTKKNERYMVIYFDETQKSRQIVHPTIAFDGNWKALANTITCNNYHSFEIK